MASIEGCGNCSTKQGLGSLSACGIGRVTAIGFQKLFDSIGDRQYIDTLSATLGADVKALTDMSTLNFDKRIFMTPKANRITLVRSDENYATDQNNQRSALGTGEIVTVTAEFWNETDIFAEKMRAWECGDSQVYFTTTKASFAGSELEDHTKLYGWRIVQGSLTARFMTNDGDNVEMVKVSFDLESTTEKLSKWAFLDSSQLGYNPTETLRPANHLEAIATAATPTTLSVVLRSDAVSSGKYNYGRQLTTAAPALAVWKVYNATTSAYLSSVAVTFTNVEEQNVQVGNEPRYTVNYAASVPLPTTNDDLRVEVVVARYLVQNSNNVDAL